MLPKTSLSTTAHWSRIFLDLEETAEFEETRPISTRASRTHRASRTPRASRTLFWVTSVERGLLLAALAKKRSEVDLLRTEVEHRPITDVSSLHEPIGPPIVAIFIVAYALGDIQAVIYLIILFLVPILILGLYASLLRLKRLKPQVLDGSIDKDRGKEKKSAKVWGPSAEQWERRMQWEAAWCWIERHLDYYADHFIAWDRHPGGTKTAVWEELVRVWRECEELE
ncbi:uncharacterized protein BDZ99DRAFT_173946 [Mytilinidion resinicola]|uniref:Uncharacterized protein n=1 Tax=Mytilinidion resinicola TaxID=574789 RepID=A0A6A6Y325_9PEZI|nr:uncharacterized protein BDZ99DRAFT_173946 [Mytilinidion resinicola]KAF2803070.1 hypothetical protein BDZ99DRAFT_173946 [Mytilinidion resinicola]